MIVVELKGMPMSRVRFVHESVFWGISLMFVFLPAVVSGCKRHGPAGASSDPVVYVIRKATENPCWPADVRQRAALAISRWENGMRNPRPIVIIASLTQTVGSEETDFTIVVFDEDKDIIGIGVRETHILPSGAEDVIDETYPIAIHAPYDFDDIVNLYWLPFEIRTANQRKDDHLWETYVNRKPETFRGLNMKWKAVVPPAWVSIPEPNKVDVWVYAYDRAGNKSEAVKLLDVRKRRMNGID